MAREINWEKAIETIEAQPGLCRLSFKEQQSGLCCLIGALGTDREGHIPLKKEFDGNFDIDGQKVTKRVRDKYGFSAKQQGKLIDKNDAFFGDEVARKLHVLNHLRSPEYQRFIESVGA